MVFSTVNLFKGIQCPEGERCKLTNCIFGHDLRPKAAPTSATATIQPVRVQNRESEEPATKRRKVTYDQASDKPPSQADVIRSKLAAARSASTVIGGVVQHSPKAGLSENGNQSQPQSLIRPISPPPTNGKVTLSQANNSLPDNGKHENNERSELRSSTQPESKSDEKLNPRLIPHDPAGHGKRALYLKHLHNEMVSLNQRVKGGSPEHKHLLVLTEHELVKMALDEEEKIARDQPLVYANIIKQRIGYYRKMKLEDWTKQVKSSFETKTEVSTTTTKDTKPIHTALTSNEELLILPHLIADQSNLAPFGYITTPPTEAQAAEAAAAVEASKNYEICDRCSARFQVFPDRNEDGLLTSNGPCKHHPNKKMFPPRSKADTAMGNLKEPYYPCCNAVVGSPGCTESDYHVFKSSTPSRLAAVLPFITTPENEHPAKDKDGRTVRAVSFDCEMGYTVCGLELVRLTAVTWPSGKALLDVLVRPLGTIIDLNSRFSGVWPEHFTNAIPYYEWRSKSPPPSSESKSAPLPVVSSPSKARELLCTYLTPKTPLIGHAIDNDLNAVRLCHPTIVDTVLLFPHPRGLPMRFGLKMLASKHLGRSIQTGGDRGHDSLEDAQATGELVRVKVQEKWKTLSAGGWKVENGRLIGPHGEVGKEGEVEGAEEKKVVKAQAMVAKVCDGQGRGKAGQKRRKRFPGLDGATDESTEDEEIEQVPAEV